MRTATARRLRVAQATRRKIWREVRASARRRLRVPMRYVFHVGRPRVAPLYPNRPRWGGKRRIGERPDRDPKSRGACIPGPTQRGSAGRAEMVIDAGPSVTRPRIDLVGTIQADGFARKIRRAAPWRAGAALAVFTMAPVDHHGLCRDGEAEVATQASGGSRHAGCLPGPLVRSAFRPCPARNKPTTHDLDDTRNGESFHRMRHKERSLLPESVSPPISSRGIGRTLPPVRLWTAPRKSSLKMSR
jgi:hypothetical protein